MTLKCPLLGEKYINCSVVGGKNEHSRLHIVPGSQDLKALGITLSQQQEELTVWLMLHMAMVTICLPFYSSVVTVDVLFCFNTTEFFKKASICFCFCCQTKEHA